MASVRLLVISVIALLGVYQLYSVFTHVPIPNLDPDPWWGKGSKGKEDTSIRDFKISVSEKDLTDLKTRLNLPSRLVPPLEGVNFTYGFNSNTLKDILDYWRNNYNWRQRESKLNTFSHYMTKIEGLDIHFVRAKSNASDGVTVRPLLLLHGWPSSFVEYLDILPLFTSPQEGGNIAFEVIIPSLPGYGFSDSSAKPGLGIPQTSQIYLKLMKRLGFNQFYVSGTDWGSSIASTIGSMYRDNVLGMQLTMLVLNTPPCYSKYALGSILPSGYYMDAAMEAYLYPLIDHMLYIFQETGHMHLQMTKPDTVGIGLNHSPEGLAAYILEKFASWTNRDSPNLPDGGFNSKFPISLDKLLDNINIYWFTKSITSSMRFYAEFPRFTEVNMDSLVTTTPTGIIFFHNEIYVEARNYAEDKYHNLLSFTNYGAGGHFAALELPQVLADDLFKLVNMVESKDKKSEL